MDNLVNKPGSIARFSKLKGLAKTLKAAARKMAEVARENILHDPGRQESKSSTKILSSKQTV